MSFRPRKVEVRGGAHAYIVSDKYGRAKPAILDWKTDVGAIVYRELHHIDLMICGQPDDFRALIWAEDGRTLTVDDVMKVVNALENGGYYLQLVADIVIDRKAGIYVTTNRETAMKNLTNYVERKYMEEWIRPTMESFIAERMVVDV